jgi:hypothetical protein
VCESDFDKSSVSHKVAEQFRSRITEERGVQSMRVSLPLLVGVVLAATSAWAAPLPASVTLKRSNLSLRGGQGPSLTRSASQQDMSSPTVKRPGPAGDSAVQKKIWSLSDKYKPADKVSIQK